MNSLGRFECPSAASSLHRRSISTSALNAKSRSVCGANRYGGGDLSRSACQNFFFAPSASFALFNVCGAEGHILLPEGGEMCDAENPVWVGGGESP